MQFKVMTFNLRLNIESDGKNAWPYRVDSVGKYLRKERPLILGTQEVLDGMLEDLVKHLPDYSYVGVTRRESEEATPIFYDRQQLDCKASGTFWLSKTPDIPDTVDFDSAFTRICTWAEFMVKTNRSIRFRVFNTHLDHVSRLAQIEGMKIIIQRMNEYNQKEYLPTILMGDFNATFNDEVIQYLDHDAKINGNPLVSCFQERSRYGATFHNYTGIEEGEPIDHIYMTQDFELIETKVDTDKPDEVYLSDHYPVICKVKLK